MTSVEISLPFPPSVNRLWRYGSTSGRAYADPRYKAWKEEAGKHVMANRKRLIPIKGHFTAEIILSHKKRRTNIDLDNRIKVCMDILQSMAVIENDSLCDGLSVAWGEAETGCRVILKAVEIRRAA